MVFIAIGPAGAFGDLSDVMGSVRSASPSLFGGFGFHCHWGRRSVLRLERPEVQRALGLAEFVHSGLLWLIVICSRQSVGEGVRARALRELALFSNRAIAVAVRLGFREISNFAE